MKKRVIALVCALMLCSGQVSASVLGTVITSWSHEIANGTEFFKNTFLSEQDGVGKQAEYYAEYIPNKNVLPAVINGEKIWGLKNIKQAEKYMKENGMVPLMGINASYFSWQTGLPMGHVISEGKIISKDTETYQSIGFKKNGEAFIAPLAIETKLTFGENIIDIAHINKYNQETTNIVNLYTADFDENNHSEQPTLNLILGDIEGNLGIGDTLTAVVEEKFNYTSAIKIPDDKIVLTLNENSLPELYDSLNGLSVGDKVTISSKSVTDSSDWEEAESGLGSVGETLIINGEVQDGFETGAAPRTAIGVTDSGSVIFYVIDGRQKPYSYGAQLKTLANRMKELGCVEAINLDGGGSTAISGIYPGTDESAVLNSPSGGNLRTCSNYIFLKNTQEPTNVLSHLYIYPFEQHYLSGYSEEIYPTAADSAYYRMDIPNNLEFSVDGTESTIESGILTAKGTGEFTVSVTSGNITGSAKYTTYETPTNINVYNGETDAEIKSLTLKKDDKVKLNLTSQYYYIDLKAIDSCYEIQVTNNLGYVNENNELVITAEDGAGALKVSAGEYTKEIPLTVESENPFKDTKDHWARDMIKEVYKSKIISGYETEDGFYFKPDNNITREEFAVLVCKFLNIDIEKYRDFDLSGYADYEEISDWAKPFVAATAERQLINGKQNGDNVNFAPKDLLTRAEAITVFGRLLAKNESEVEFGDYEEVPVWAKPYVSAMVSKGFITGYEDNTIRPQNTVTRAETITIIYKIMKSDIFFG